MKALEKSTDIRFQDAVVCTHCKSSERVQVFNISVSAGSSIEPVAWCPVCAKEVIKTLSTAFPGDELPTWFRMMAKLSSYWEEGSK